MPFIMRLRREVCGEEKRENEAYFLFVRNQIWSLLKFPFPTHVEALSPFTSKFLLRGFNAIVICHPSSRLFSADIGIVENLMTPGHRRCKPFRLLFHPFSDPLRQHPRQNALSYPCQSSTPHSSQSSSACAGNDRRVTRLSFHLTSDWETNGNTESLI